MERSIRISATNGRVISIGSGLPAIPERLLLAHARGEVLFIAGAGISQPASLPDFRGLVLGVYAQLDTAVHAVISSMPIETCYNWNPGESLRHEAAKEIEVGPLKSACRCRFQTASSCCGQKPWW